MPTSVHIPRHLLEAADRKARALGVSRNRLIVRALERELTPGADWTPGFFEMLSSASADTVGAVREMQRAIVKGRRSKQPVRF